jgi:hypothetical protein
MKLLKSILLFIVIGIIVPINVFAAENDYARIDTVEMASKGDEISVNIVIVSEKEINEFKSTFTYETGVLELLNVESKSDGWKMTSKFSKESPLTLDFSHDSGLMGESTIATLKFKVKNDSTKTDTILNIEGATKVKEDETIVTLEKVSKTIAIKSRDNTLSDIKFNGTTLNNFSPKQSEYIFEIESSVTTENFQATLNDKTATFKEGFAPKTGAPLDYGENKFEIVVVSATGEEKKYVITITRQDNRGTNNDLKELVINSNNKLIDFNPNTLLYTITTHKLTTIDIVAVSKDPKATVKIDKPEKLEFGNNKVLITVISENKEEKVYTLMINNLDKDIDTTLSGIELFGCDESINFEKDKYDYEILYKNKYKDSLVIKPVLSNGEEAVAKIDKDSFSNLKAGDKVTITVSAKDGTQNVENYYTILFKKDNRVNFFLLLSLIIFIVLLVTFIKLLISRKKRATVVNVESEVELEKTKRLEKINLE